MEGDVLYNDTIYYAKSMFDHLFSALAHPFSNMEIRMTDHDIQQIDRSPKPLKIKDDTLLEVNYDHFDTAVFQRRVVLLKDAADRTVGPLKRT